MAQFFMSLGMLVQPPNVPPVFSSTEEIIEYHDESLSEKSDADYVDYVLSESRKDWLKYHLNKLCVMANVNSLGFLYGDSTVQHDRAFEESVEGLGTWCIWKEWLLAPAVMEQAITGISDFFDWSRQHLPELNKLLFNGYGSEDDLRAAIDQPVITKEPTLDERVENNNDGDSEWCLYSYLASMEQLMRNALERNAKLLYLVQVPA